MRSELNSASIQFTVNWLGTFHRMQMIGRGGFQSLCYAIEITPKYPASETVLVSVNDLRPYLLVKIKLKYYQSSQIRTK